MNATGSVHIIQGKTRYENTSPAWLPSLKTSRREKSSELLMCSPVMCGRQRHFSTASKEALDRKKNGKGNF